MAEAAGTAPLRAAGDDRPAASSSAGVSVAVLWPDGSMGEGAAGFADETAGGVLAPDDTMRMGSITKTFVAAVTL